MKVINDIEFYKPCDILDLSNNELDELLEGNLNITNLDDEQELYNYICQYFKNKSIDNYMRRYPYRVGEFSATSDGHGMNFEFRLNKEDSLNLCKNAAESFTMYYDFEENPDEPDMYNVIRNEDVSIFDLANDDNFNKVTELLDGYSITFIGMDNHQGFEILNIIQNFKIILDGVEYTKIEDLPNEEYSNLLSAFSKIMCNEVLENISIYILSEILQDIEDNTEYLNDYMTATYNNKKLEDTDFYKWFEDNKILISKDRKYWIIDGE